MSSVPNWSEIVDGLREAGMTFDGIASDLGVSVWTVRSYWNGRIADPSWSVGDALLTAWQRAYPRRRLPRREPVHDGRRSYRSEQ